MITLSLFIAGVGFIFWGLYLFFANKEESKSVVVKKEATVVIKQTEDELIESKIQKEIVLPLIKIARVFWKNEVSELGGLDIIELAEVEKIDEKIKKIIKINKDEKNDKVVVELPEQIKKEKEEIAVTIEQNEKKIIEEIQTSETIETKAEEIEEKTTTETKTITEVLTSTVFKETKDFFNQCIEPYREVIVKQYADVLIERLISYIEENRHHSSVCLGTVDSETVTLNSVKDTLVQVTLREHTYTVVRELVDLVKQSYKDQAAEGVMPFYLVCGLAHDIGKTPQVRLTGLYNSHEHALCSANKLRELADGCNIGWLDRAITVINGHHGTSEMQEIKLLKKADQKARSLELARFTKEFEVGEYKKYFNEEEFFRDYILPEVNVTQKGLWQAVTLKGILFVSPDLLYKQMKKLGQDKKKLDILFFYEDEKENVKRGITALLKEKGFVHEMLPEGWYSMLFEVRTSTPAVRKMKIGLVPLKLDKILKICDMDLATIEKRKTDFLALINDLVQTK